MRHCYGVRRGAHAPKDPRTPWRARRPSTDRRIAENEDRDERRIRERNGPRSAPREHLDRERGDPEGPRNEQGLLDVKEGALDALVWDAPRRARSENEDREQTADEVREGNPGEADRDRGVVATSTREHDCADRREHQGNAERPKPAPEVRRVTHGARILRPPCQPRLGDGEPAEPPPPIVPEVRRIAHRSLLPAAPEKRRA